MTCCEKEKDVAQEVGQHFSETNVLLLDPGDKHNTIQLECRNEVKKQAWTVGEESRQPKTPKAL